LLRFREHGRPVGENRPTGGSLGFQGEPGEWMVSNTQRFIFKYMYYTTRKGKYKI
jgi:hypothetical protein